MWWSHAVLFVLFGLCVAWARRHKAEEGQGPIHDKVSLGATGTFAVNVCRGAPASQLRFPLKSRDVQTGQDWAVATGTQHSSAVWKSSCMDAALRGCCSVSILCLFLHGTSKQQRQTDPPVPGPQPAGLNSAPVSVLACMVMLTRRQQSWGSLWLFCMMKEYTP